MDIVPFSGLIGSGREGEGARVTGASARGCPVNARRRGRDAV